MKRSALVNSTCFRDLQRFIVEVAPLVWANVDDQEVSPTLHDAVVLGFDNDAVAGLEGRVEQGLLTSKFLEARFGKCDGVARGFQQAMAKLDFQAALPTTLGRLEEFGVPLSKLSAYSPKTTLHAQDLFRVRKWFAWIHGRRM